VVEILVGENYAPQVPYAYAGLGQGSAYRIRLVWEASIDQRGAFFLIQDQG
jgi:hypothetical protein